MSGVLRWTQLDQLWRSMATVESWYLYEPGRELPTNPISQNRLLQVARQINSFLHQEHDADYCGLVYTDDLNNPSLLKIYHPKKWGLHAVAVVQPFYLNGHYPGSLR